MRKTVEIHEYFEDLQDVINWANENKVEYKDITFSSYLDYDDSPTIGYYYEREETNGERLTRESLEKIRQKNQEDYERRQYETLKAKFG